MALVVELSSASQPQLHLRLSVMEVDLEGDQRQGLGLGLNHEFVDLAAVCQELSLSISLVASKSRRVLPLGDVKPEQPQLVVIDSGICVGELRLPLSK